jgi:hypothetical protein
LVELMQLHILNALQHVGFLDPARSVLEDQLEDFSVFDQQVVLTGDKGVGDDL